MKNGLNSVRARNPPVWNVIPFPAKQSDRHSDSAECEKRLTEFMRTNGILRFNTKEYQAKREDLEFLRTLGSGTCGVVQEMRFKPTGDIMAVKQMRRSCNKEENKRVLMDLEVVMRSHDCPYIVKYYGCFITDSEVWICMELMTTCLDKLIKAIRTGIPERVLGKMAVSIVKALDYLKEKLGIIHRDVKPSNMLLDMKGTIKLCDFGISGRLVDSIVKSGNAGCTAYMAPEKILPDGHGYDIRSDVWSLGISLVELATGRFPYESCSTDFELCTRILQDPPPKLSTSDGFSQEFCNFVDKCLAKNCAVRPKFQELLVRSRDRQCTWQ
ncbi:unnamed protein product [Soboliphyme baturini]|uniref:mitogen-activated protein kinase kinase n=1 Tax=Soboliphyme baturini TaxID=241478 RepID=A0A183IY33_9BILA|nr:unnamed protein product [Soboliphyme baturini]